MTWTTDSVCCVCIRQHELTARLWRIWHLHGIILIGIQQTNKLNTKYDLIFIPISRRKKQQEQNTMARPSKDLFLQFQEHLNNEQEVREVSSIDTY